MDGAAEDTRKLRASHVYRVTSGGPARPTSSTHIFSIYVTDKIFFFFQGGNC